ncbi:MAG TPA: o-succinylbenzoate synthase [Acidimicrobiales bacterium]
MTGSGDEDHRPPADAWSLLGAEGSTVLDGAELLRVDLPFAFPVETAVGTHRHRPVVLVHLTAHRPDGTPVEGWGECAALADTTYDAEDADSAFAWLEASLLPILLRASARSGALPPVGDLDGLGGGAGHRLARSAVEMAVADAHLRSAGRSLADQLEVAGMRVPAGAVLGLPRSVGQLATDLERLAAAGFARVKVKIAPGAEAIIDGAVRPLLGSGLLVQVDANGTYGDDAADRLAPLDDLGLVCIEQPLGRRDLDGHRRLAAALATPICLDESLDAPSSVVEAVETGACSMVCVKPARLGGIGAALEVISWCGDRGVPWWIGGMFETGFARGVNRALAARPGRSFPGDLSSPTTYLTGDLVGPEPGGIDARSGHLTFPVPAGPGLGPAPDRSLLEPWTVRRVPVSAPTA